MPKKFNNVNVVFRCPDHLKNKMRLVAEESGQHLSAFIRSACVDRLRIGADPVWKTIRKLDQ